MLANSNLQVRKLLASNRYERWAIDCTEPHMTCRPPLDPLKWALSFTTKFIAG